MDASMQPAPLSRLSDDALLRRCCCRVGLLRAFLPDELRLGDLSLVLLGEPRLLRLCGGEDAALGDGAGMRLSRGLEEGDTWGDMVVWRTGGGVAPTSLTTQCNYRLLRCRLPNETCG
jgi:hypothetical protein